MDIVTMGLVMTFASEKSAMVMSTSVEAERIETMVSVRLWVSSHLSVTPATGRRISSDTNAQPV